MRLERQSWNTTTCAIPRIQGVAKKIQRNEMYKEEKSEERGF